MRRGAPTTVRVLLWLTIAVPATWATLWIFERLQIADVFGSEAAGSMWLFGAALAVALLAGGAVAYAGDRALLALRERSRPIGRVSRDPSV